MKNEIKKILEDRKTELKRQMSDISCDFCGDYDIDSDDYICDAITEYADGQVDIYTSDLLEWAKNNYEYVLRHEVINPNGENYNEDLFYAFGHIHGRNQYKRNGIDVGIDANNYTPIDSDLLDWMHDAVCKYVDENVFTDVCK